MREFIKLTFILTLVTAAATFIAADHKLELRIRPPGNVFVRPLGGSIMFTCELSPTQVKGETFTLYTTQDDVNFSHTTPDTANTSTTFGDVTNVTSSPQVLRDLLNTQVIQEVFNPQGIYSNDSYSVSENTTEPWQSFQSHPSSQNASVGTVVHRTSKLQWLNKDTFEIRPRRTALRPVYVEDEEVIDDKRIKKLYISSIQNQHAGEYRCIERADNDDILQTVAVRLHLYRKIQFDNGTPSVVLTSVDGSAVLPCKASGYPMPVVTWRFNGSRIITKPNGRLVQTPSGLRIGSIAKSDAGVYRCRAVVEASGDYEEKQVQLLVRARPEFNVNIGVVYGVKTQALYIQCKVSGGIPAPTYSLFKNENEDVAAAHDEHIESNDRIRFNTDTGLIEISDVQLSDEGQYVCVATNEMGEARSTINILVHEIPEIATFHSVTALRFGSASLRCESPGQPMPNITFHRLSPTAQLTGTAGRPSRNVYDISEAREFVYGQNEDGRIVITLVENGSAILYISNLSTDDSCVYSCTASNKYGTDRRLGSLVVVYPPTVVNITPSPAYLVPDRAHNLTCIADSNPRPLISWTQNNETLSDNEFFHIYSTDVGSILEVVTGQSTSNTSSLLGTYTCIASNDYGNSQLDTEVREATVPATPRNVTVFNYTTSSVELRVTPPEWDGGAPVQGYQVQYKQIQLAYKRGSVILIKGLQPNTSYVIDIRATNEVGAGGQHTVNVTTMQVDNSYKLAAIQNGVDALSCTRTTALFIVFSCFLTATTAITKPTVSYTIR